MTTRGTLKNFLSNIGSTTDSITYTHDSQNNVNQYENNLFIDNINLWDNNTAISEQNPSNRKIIKIIDVLGRENSSNSNAIYLYIYDDNTVEKKVILK